MAWNHIVFACDERGIAMLTINRPQKLNALNAGVIAEIEQAISEVESSPSIRALLITGAGEKAFVAGADIQELAAMSPVETHALALRGQRLLRRIEQLRKPAIAAINGFALGGGLELAMSCSIRVAAPNAKMGQPEVKLGIIPGYGGTQRLPRLVGRGRALEMLLTGEPIDAAEAHRIGLVNHVVPLDQLLHFSRNLIEQTLANGPLAVALAIEAVDIGLEGGLDSGLRFEAAAFALAAATNDRREGTSAFLEKRRPAFQGN